ncbi:hypothetical protein CR513_15208, partial [Mucuna pruriens]
MSQGFLEGVVGIFKEWNDVVGDVGGGLCVFWEVVHFRQRKFHVWGQFGETVYVSWGGHETHMVTLLSYEFGKLKVWDHVTKG